MTLNQILKRLKTLAESHKQINTFFIGGFDEFMDSPDVTYPACFCELDKNHSVGMDTQLNILKFNFYFFDLMDTAQNSQANEYEVKSDMLEVAKDFYAMLKYTGYQFDWKIGDNCPITISDYELTDICAGVSLAVEIGIPYDANRCQVPASGVTFETDYSDRIIVNDVIQVVADPLSMPSNYPFQVVTEGQSITLSNMINKKILFFFLGDKLLTSVIDNAAPTPNQYRYTAQTGLFEFGTDTQIDQIIQILNRPL